MTDTSDKRMAELREASEGWPEDWLTRNPGKQAIFDLLAKVAELEATLDVRHEHIGKLETKVAKLENQIERNVDYSKRVAELEGRLAVRDPRTNDLVERVGEPHPVRRIENLEARVANLELRVARSWETT